MAKRKIDPDMIIYLDIRDQAFTYSQPDEPNTTEEQNNPTAYSYEIVKMFSLEKEIIRLDFTIDLQSLLPGGKRIKGSYTTEHLYLVRDLKAFVVTTGNQYEVNTDLEDMLTDIAYSTIRGLLRHKFTGTQFAKFILPVKSPSTDQITPPKHP
ncbi:MAG TPA: hypothetical protein VFE32_12640 [Puia sp.]|jgi:hypothetical protein|nr:hypothetical protein [Puia sp.]